MPIVSLVSFLGYVTVAFGIRTWLQVRWTGSTGLVGVRAGASAIERLAGAAVGLAFVLSAIGPFVGAPLVSARALVVFGAALCAAATVATFVAQLAMRASWRIGVDEAARTELVTTGPFRVVRNPIFTAMIVAASGIALACATPLSLAAPALLFVGLELQVRIVEEPYLVRVHGDRYRRWAARTGRFVPGLGTLSER